MSISGARVRRDRRAGKAGSETECHGADTPVSVINTTSGRHARRRNALLWTAQGLVAGLFLFAGGMKLAMPIALLGQATKLPGGFMRFIAVAELVGALGLVLPGLFRVKLSLTPLAAAGFVIIMMGATTLTAAMQGIAPAAFPFVVGALLVVIMRGRREWTAGVRVREGGSRAPNARDAILTRFNESLTPAER